MLLDKPALLSRIGSPPGAVGITHHTWDFAYAGKEMFSIPGGICNVTNSHTQFTVRTERFYGR